MKRYKTLKTKIVTFAIIGLFVMSFLTYCMNDFYYNENENNLSLMKQYVENSKTSSNIDGYLFSNTEKFIKKIIACELNIRNASHSFVITDRYSNNKSFTSNTEDESTIKLPCIAIAFTTSCYFLLHKNRKWFTSCIFCLSFIVQLVITYIHKRDGKKRMDLVLTY